MANQKCLILYLVAVNVIFLMAGVVMLVMDIKEQASPRTSSSIFNDSTTASRNSFQSVLSLLLSLAKVIMSVFGLAGVFTKSRMILTGFSSLLTVDIVMRIIVLVMAIMTCATAVSTTAEAMQKVFHLYGNHSDASAIEFTKTVDDFASKKACCGWSLNVNDNLYTSTAWFQLRKAEAAASGNSQNPQTLPKSCCVPSQPEERCIRTKDMKAARNSGLVHESCLDIVARLLRYGLYIAIVAHSFLLALNAVSMFAALMLMRDIESLEEQDEEVGTKKGNPRDEFTP